MLITTRDSKIKSNRSRQVQNKTTENLVRMIFDCFSVTPTMIWFHNVSFVRRTIKCSAVVSQKIEVIIYPFYYLWHRRYIWIDNVNYLNRIFFSPPPQTTEKFPSIFTKPTSNLILANRLTPSRIFRRKPAN